jgi:predicted GNAT family N-acyltransferase
MNITVADFERDYAAIRGIRFAVFVDEQQIPRDLEMDDRDVACTHWLATDESGEPIGTVRLDIEAGGKVGRLAVLARARGRGVGRALMERVHELARARGLARVWCHAQQTAAPFYARLRYRTTSEPFDEAGIEHVKMECDLSAWLL